MINIFSIPLYYISLKPETDLEKNLRKRGFTNINFFKAINGRKFTPEYLLEKNMITIRTYTDLKTSRQQHSGIPSLGAIGCTMSHYALWNLCIIENLPYIAIAESDLFLYDISLKDQEKIKEILNKPNSLYISAKVKKRSTTEFIGSHFYIASREACKELVKKAFPIDIQTDWYIAHLDNIRKIDVDGFDIGKQKNHKSSIQDLCVKCMLPTSKRLYIITILAIILIILINIALTIYLYKCNLKKSCKSIIK